MKQEIHPEIRRDDDHMRLREPAQSALDRQEDALEHVRCVPPYFTGKATMIGRHRNAWSSSASATAPRASSFQSFQARSALTCDLACFFSMISQEYISRILARLAEVEALLSDAAIATNPKRLQELVREHNRLKRIKEKADAFGRIQKEIAESRALADGDPRTPR